MDINIFELLTHENLIFLAILSCGLYTGYTDFRYGKIANSYTLTLIALGGISQALFITAGEITWAHSCATVLGGFGISFAMFYTGIWAAGDAKLFWGIILLMPPSAFSQTVETQFYPLILLTNIFLLFFIYVTVKAVYKMPLRLQQQLISESFRMQLKQFPRRILEVFSYITVGGLAFYIPSRLGIELDFALRLALFVMIAFAFNKGVRRHIPEKYQLAFDMLFVPLAIFLLIRSLIDLGSLIFYIFLISLCLLIFSSYVRSLFTKPTPIKALKPNMIPAERILRMPGPHATDIHVKVPVGFANPAADNIVVDVSSEGLTQAQIADLQRLAEQGCFLKFGNSLLIQEKIPFAFMIVAGALVNFLAKGMVHSFLRDVDISQIL